MGAIKLTGWHPANVDPLRIGYYEMINESTGTIFTAWYSGCMWFRDLHGPTVPLLRVWPWRGLAQEPQKQTLTPRLIHCAASRDGECSHAKCPQLRDNEPATSGRHCPLDIGDEDEL